MYRRTGPSVKAEGFFIVHLLMMQTIINPAYFQMLFDRDKNLITYLFNDGATCSIWANASDKLHGDNLGITGIDHKLLHEITHHYVAQSLGLSCCPVVYAEAHKKDMPANAGYLEEIVFSVVYFTKEKAMLFNNWHSYLDRLHGKVNLYDLKNKLLNVCSNIEQGKLFITL